MSAPAFAWAFEMGVKLKLTSGQLLLLAYMADQANCTGHFYTGQPRLAKFTRMTERHIRKLIPELEALGLIRVDATPGKLTHYHILRQPIGAELSSSPVPTSAPAHSSSPANGAGPPRNTVPPIPRNSASLTPELSSQTPEHSSADPFSTQEENPKTREGARGKPAKDSDSGEKASKPAAAPPAAPPKAPVLGATPGGGGSQALTIPGRSSDAFLDDPKADDALPKAEADPLDAPVDPARALAAFAEMRLALRMKAYPPRAAVLSREEQMALCEARPRPKALYLTREQIQATAMTQQFARTV